MAKAKVIIEIVIFSVGSADCIHVHCFGATTIEDRQFLIDTGRKSTFDRIKTQLVNRSKKIDFILLTHNHVDHIEGLPLFIKEECFQVKRIFYWAQNALPGPSTSESLNILLEMAISQKIDIVSMEPGVRSLDMYIGDKVKVLHPFGDLAFQNSPNHDSIVLAFQVGDTNLLFMGDATTREEKVIINRCGGPNLNNTAFLKVGHHGISYSSGASFISHISKNGKLYAICSCKSSRNSKPPNIDKLKEITSIIQSQGGKLFLTGEYDKLHDIIITLTEDGDVQVREERVI